MTLLNSRWTVAAGFVALGLVPVHAQAPSSQELTLQVSVADRTASQQAQRQLTHYLPIAGQRLHRDHVSDFGPARRTDIPAFGSGGVRHIGTLTYQGGPVMASAVEHALYLIPSNGACPNVATCWGNPTQFLADLGRSEFIHVTDQYVGTTANGRYTVGISGKLSYSIPAQPLVDTDIQAIVHAMVVADGGLNGYGHEYHVFLPPGQDECFDNTYSVCYSPDNPPTFSFCAYHSSVDFTDVGHVIYSVEPYGDVSGCTALLPNGSFVTSQNSILSHETIESITDPDGDAWWNASGNLDLYGYEIGDECQWITFSSAGAAGFLLDDVFLGGRPYLIQSEYNNQANGCTDGPGPGGF